MDMTKIADTLADSLPTRESLINAIGLATRRSTSSDLASAIGIFAAGLLVGAGLALLFAPKTGEQLRRDLGDRLAPMPDQGDRAVERAMTNTASA